MSANDPKRTSAGLASAKITTERLLVVAEEARTKAMSERGGSAAAIAAITAIAKLSGKWIENKTPRTREKQIILRAVHWNKGNTAIEQ
jgi:hypothetical protein